MRNEPTFTIVERTLSGRMTPAYLSLYWAKHTVHGLLEVDVTRPRHLIAEEEARTGERLSFTGFLVSCVARAVDENKAVQAYRKGRKQLAIFDDVDVFVPVERGEGTSRVPVPLIVRAAQRKSLVEISGEIRVAQASPPGAEGLPPIQRLLAAPWPLPVLTVKLIRVLSRRDPRRLVRAAGTVGVTALGMAGRRGGWGMAPGGQSLLLIVGGITAKPRVVNGAVEPREVLHLTVAFDHDVVDGAPAARFADRLVHLIEAGHELPQEGDERET